MPNKIEVKDSSLVLSKSRGTRGKRPLTAQLQAARLDLHEILNQLSVISVGCFTPSQLAGGDTRPLRRIRHRSKPLSAGELSASKNSVRASKPSSNLPSGKTGAGFASLFGCRQSVSLFHVSSERTDESFSNVTERLLRLRKP